PSPRQARCRLHPPQPRQDQAPGLQMDRRGPADPRRGHRRDGRTLPAAWPAGGRQPTADAPRSYRSVDRSHGTISAQPVAASVDSSLKRLRILLLTHPDLIPPESLKGLGEAELFQWKTEIDLITTLKKMGHDVRPQGLQAELARIHDAIVEWKPDIVFNL